MTQTVKIEGMMCAMCEKHMKNALEKIDGIEYAVTSHEAGTAVITISKPVDEAAIKTAVEEEGYKFLEIV